MKVMNGIDVYEGDNISDWNVIKNTDGISVVIQKATQGLSHVDSLLNYRYPRIKQAGLKLGFYHYANGNDPTAEAKHFLKTISGLESDTVLWLDIEGEENWSRSNAINFANAFIKYVQSQGRKIGVYSGYAFYKDYLQGNIPDVPLWIASYGRQPSLYPDNASWQYSETGKLNGAVGYVDLDYFIEDIFTGNVSPAKPNTLVQQIKALQYNLNLDYSAKLAVDGIAGPATTAALKGIQNIIVKGHKSHVVLWIQQKLEQYGYLKKNSYTPMVYDEATFQAITNLQNNWRKATDGILGPDTWSIFLNN
ncbi:MULTISPECIES: GH25 family lysozyme [Clostridium]|uniref:Autolytic lysozyme n=2 Tax=Clostridium TaxID=1485 RepID=A0A1A6AVX2_9CLOT|nr:MULTISPECIES: GH25 family lysozyme [Clostridium]OBR94175.1 autolytic lysozyme [Clostridium ragsdalei P11]